MRFLVLAILVGVGLTAIAALSINIPVSVVMYCALVVLTPGGIIASLVWKKSADLGHTLPFLMGDVFFYSSAAYLFFRYVLRPQSPTVRMLVVAMILPVTVMAVLACTPTLSPIWPRGMDRLRAEEESLRSELSVGTDLDSARRTLKKAGLDGSEQEMQSGGIVLWNGKKQLTAQPGERAIWARSETIAEQFPCTYTIQVALIFATDGKLRDKYVGAEGTCP